MRSKAASSKAETPTKPGPRMIEQPGGRGALMAAGQGQGGRPKEVLRARCREQIETRRGIEFVGGVLDGTETEDVTVTVGSGKDARTEVVQVRPKFRDRMLAFELLSDRGYGKPEQGLVIEDERPRRTGEETMARIMELLPLVIPLLPTGRKEIARLLAERRDVEVLVQGRDVPA